MSVFSHMRPIDEREFARVLAEAHATKTPLEVMGAGSKQAIGRPMQTAASISSKAMRGITLYEPTEMVMAARTGTPLSQVETALAERGQMLAFEPVDYGPMLGGEGSQATIGGVFAANVSGARRVAIGAARDHLLGIRGVNGRGDVFKSGGRVMKNVTGYDLCRGLSGSWGTLAVLSEVTFKVLPAPEDTATLVLHRAAGRHRRGGAVHRHGEPVRGHRRGAPAGAAGSAPGAPGPQGPRRGGDGAAT